MNNLIIIGNGFDLAHNLKTSYNDFIDYILESQIKDKTKFKDIISIIPSIDSIETFKGYLKGDHVGFMNVNNKFFKLLIDDISLNNWCDIEKKYYTVLMDLRKNGYRNIGDFHVDFKIVKNHLSDYLSQIEKNQDKKESYNCFFSLLLNSESRILNFNYTNTLDRYLVGIPNNTFINIHGELDSVQNPIIFGFAADDYESRELISKDNKEYIRFIKKHCYKRTDNENRLNEFLKDHNKINVFILGHSSGVSDKLILNQIFNHPNIKSITNFYFEEYENFFSFQYNVDRIMNNDENFKKLVSFKSSHRMPQLTDSKEQTDSFNRYIDKIIDNNKPRTMIEPGVF